MAFEILRFETMTDRDGLSQNTVRCLLQDRQGFIWIGTINGLNRYNGKEFSVMQPQSGSSDLLPDNRIRSMLEDHHGYIWIRTTSNILSCYDSRLERFIDYDPDNPEKDFSYFKTFSNGDVWLWGLQGGCCRIQHNGTRLQARWFNEKDLGTKAVNFVFEDSKNQIWIGTNNDLYRISGDDIIRVASGSNFYNAHEVDQRVYFITNANISAYAIRQQKYQSGIIPFNCPSTFNGTALLNNGLILIASRTEMFALDTRKNEIIPAETLIGSNNLVNINFYTDNKNSLWLYNKTGILLRHLGVNNFEKIKAIPPDIMSAIDLERYEIFHDSHDIIWITTYGNGLFALDQKTGLTHHYRTDNSDLPTNYLLCVMEDLSGEIWVGTEFAGMTKVSLTNYSMKVFYPSPEEKNNRSNSVRLIYEDSDSRYWIGTRTGYLHIYDSVFNKIHSHYIPGGLPFVLAEDTSGNKWLGTRGKGVLVYPSSGKAAPRIYGLHDQEYQSSSSNNIFDITRDSKNRMWVASFGGGLHLAENNNGEITFRQINMKSRIQDMMRVLIQDSSGIMWVGTNEGVNAFHPDELLDDPNQYINFSYHVNDDRSIRNNEVKAIFEDSKGRLWFGTTGGGLNLLMREDPLEKSWFKHYTAQNGLFNEVIQAILEDDQGNIWVSTEGGISKFDPQTERFENFSFSENKQAVSFSEAACWKEENGELMFGSYFGVYIFNPSKLTYDTYTPDVVFTGLVINGVNAYPEGNNSPLSESITTSKEIRLKYFQNSFNLEFAMFNYHFPDLNQYAYYLEGFEKEWNPTTRYNVAAYRNVPPGTYLFKVKGSNSFGVWTENESMLKVIITPPFWKSGWAFAGYFILLVIALIFTVHLIRKFHRLNTAIEVEKQLTEYKLRFFTNISHEFRTPLTIIRGSIENLTGMKNLPLSVSKQIYHMSKSSTRLLRLIDQLLEFRRLQNNRMELKLEKTEAISFFYDIFTTFQELAQKKHIEFLFRSDFPTWDMLLDRGKMDKIVYNLLSNAMKHTPEHGTILFELNFSTPDDLLILSVSDSGSGIPKEKRNSLFVRFEQISHSSGGTGVGLHLTAELASVHKGKVDYTESHLGGACFRVSIPLSEKNYHKEDIIDITDARLSEKITDTDIDTGQAIEETPKALEKPFKEYKLLIIDDDDEVREYVVNQLSDFFTVIAAENGMSGMEKANHEQPDLIVCDVMMPDMNGFEVTRRLKEDFQSSHIPIILLTAHSSDEHQLEGINVGAEAYIIKPFSMKYLVTRIIKMIEQREKLQRKFVKEPGIVRQMVNLPDKDRQFLDKIHEVIEQNMENIDFSVDTFAQSIGMGRTVFYKKVKGITGHSPNEYLRIIRMKKAAELLSTTELNVSEVSYKVGINDPFYFSKCFKAQFGKSPSQFQKGA